MKCPKYQSENPYGAQFSGLCGQSLKTQLTYPQCGHALIETAPETPLPSPIPTSFAGGRYQVKKFLSEGGKKKAPPRSRHSA